MNNVKLEHPAYYCNSYPEQSVVPVERSSSVDAMVVSATYCEYTCVSISQKNCENFTKGGSLDANTNRGVFNRHEVYFLSWYLYKAVSNKIEFITKKSLKNTKVPLEIFSHQFNHLEARNLTIKSKVTPKSPNRRNRQFKRF